MVYISYNTFRLNIGVYHRNWPRYGLRWSGLCCHSQHSTSAVQGVAAQTTKAQTVQVVNFYSPTKTKQYTTINPATIMTMSRHAGTPWLITPLWWWKRPHERCVGGGSTNHDRADRISGQFLFYHENEAMHNDKSRDDHDDEPPCWNALADNAIVMMKASIDTMSE